MIALALALTGGALFAAAVAIIVRATRRGLTVRHPGRPPDLYRQTPIGRRADPGFFWVTDRWLGCSECGGAPCRRCARERGGR